MENNENGNQLKRTQRDYSLAFKLQLIDEIEKGYLTYKQAQAKYGIQGRSTVLIWLRKHGTLDWKSKIPVKSKQTPMKKINDLEKKIKRLEAEKEILNRAIDIADDTLGTQIRKKYLLLSLEASKGQEEKDNQRS
jgi:transposase-like protein